MRKDYSLFLIIGIILILIASKGFNLWEGITGATWIRSGNYIELHLVASTSQYLYGDSQQFAFDMPLCYDITPNECSYLGGTWLTNYGGCQMPDLLDGYEPFWGGCSCYNSYYGDCTWINASQLGYGKYLQRQGSNIITCPPAGYSNAGVTSRNLDAKVRKLISLQTTTITTTIITTTTVYGGTTTTTIYGATTTTQYGATTTTTIPFQQQITEQSNVLMIILIIVIIGVFISSRR